MNISVRAKLVININPADLSVASDTHSLIVVRTSLCSVMFHRQHPHLHLQSIFMSGLVICLTRHIWVDVHEILRSQLIINTVNKWSVIYRYFVRSRPHRILDVVLVIRLIGVIRDYSSVQLCILKIFLIKGCPRKTHALRNTHTFRMVTFFDIPVSHSAKVLILQVSHSDKTLLFVMPTDIANSNGSPDHTGVWKRVTQVSLIIDRRRVQSRIMTVDRIRTHTCWTSRYSTSSITQIKVQVLKCKLNHTLSRGIRSQVRLLLLRV